MLNIEIAKTERGKDHWDVRIGDIVGSINLSNIDKKQVIREVISAIDTESSKPSLNSSIVPNSSCIARASKKDCYDFDCKDRVNVNMLDTKCHSNICDRRKRSPS